jgi:microcompartment protein CcmK/EutM
MQIARVIGTVVSTQKHRKFDGAKLMLVQPLNLDDTPRGWPLLAVDGVGAGVREHVLIVLEGRAAGEALGNYERLFATPSLGTLAARPLSHRLSSPLAGIRATGSFPFCGAMTATGRA